MADQMFQALKVGIQPHHDYSRSGILSFTFDSINPVRNSLKGMVTTLLAQTIMNIHNLHLWNDLFLMRGGWSDTSCLSMFRTMVWTIFERKTVLLLHDFDECDPVTRAQFLAYYEEISNLSESRFKLIITSRKPNALLSELQHWSKINVDDRIMQTTEEDNAKSIGDEVLRRDATLDRLTSPCPLIEESDLIRNLIGQKLVKMESTALDNMLHIFEVHTGWPKDPSLNSLSQFIGLLAHVQPDDKPETILDRILRFTAESEEDFFWILSWVLCGYRPLTLWELSDALLIHRQKYGHRYNCDLTSESSRRWSIDTTSKCLEIWLRVLVDFTQDEITIRDEISPLLVVDTDTDKYIWNEAKRSGHQAIYDFCAAHLTLPRTIQFVESILQHHVKEPILSHSTTRLVPPITPNGQTITFYAIQGLPNHLRHCESSDTNSNAALASVLASPDAKSWVIWAQAHWAMSNPLSRTQDIPRSALPVLFSLGVASCKDLRGGHDNERVQCIMAAAENVGSDVVSNFFNRPSTPTLTDSAAILVACIQAGDERAALSTAKYMQNHPEWNPAGRYWPQFALWSACWLNMQDLSEMLLSNGVKPDIESDEIPTESSPFRSDRLGFYTSPLYMASLLGHAAIVRILLRHNARTDLLRGGRFGSFHAACGNGSADAVLEYVAVDRSFLQARQPNTGLYIASDRGNTKVVEALLDLGAEPNGEQGSPDNEEPTWSPLARACQAGRVGTVRLLLQYGADVNSKGPYGMDTPLWFAACRNPSVEVVQILLENSADPNDKLLEPPLITEIAMNEGITDMSLKICDLLVQNKIPIRLNSTNSSGQTALMIAADKGKLALVKWLRNHGADVDILDNNNASALLFAIKNGHVEVVQELLKYNPQFEVESASQPLSHEALDHPEILKLMLAAGADPNAPDKAGMRLINKASSTRRKEIVQILIDNNADINQKDPYGWAPINDAVAYAPEIAIVRLLVDNGAKLDVTIDDKNLIHQAIYVSLEILQILLEFHKAIDINHRNSKGNTALHLAAWGLSLDALRLLVKAGGDVNAQDSIGLTPLHVLAYQNHQGPLFKLLLAQPDIKLDVVAPSVGYPLHLACRNIETDNVRILTEAGANVEPMALNNILASTPLMAAVMPREDADREQDSPTVDSIVRMLVFRGASVQRTVPGSCLYTSLSAACWGASVNIINFLLDEGASTQMADPVSGRLPLHFAAANGIENFQAVLLAYQGDMMVSDQQGKNCLHWAAQCGNKKTVEFILSKLQQQDSTGRLLASYVNKPDNDDWTPLCWAARPHAESWTQGMRSEERDFAGVIRVLLRHKASTAVQCRLEQADTHSFDKFTPLDLAQRCGADANVIQLLKDRLDDADAGNASDQRRNLEIEEPPISSVRRWAPHSTLCNFCLNPIFGLVYRCQSCVNFDICSKCLSSIENFHTGKTQGDDKEHILLKRSDRPEYIDPPPPHHAEGTEPPDGLEYSDPLTEGIANHTESIISRRQELGPDGGGDVHGLMSLSDVSDISDLSNE